MHAHYFQHVPFEGLGSIASWLKSENATVTATRFYETPSLPNVEDIDLLIVMGGPMSANDEDIMPWLADEKAFIRTVIRQNKAVLGVCLGAQLIASALGARIYRNSQKEIGWFPVTAVPKTASESGFTFPPQTTVFHWHGETFDLPPGAMHLARSPVCEHQAFQIGRRVIGLQFHLETTSETAKAIVDNCRDELTPAPYVQSEPEILAASTAQYQAINTLMADILTYLT